MAASYVSMGRSTLLREVQEGRAPPPINLTPGGCRRWLKERLDAWVDDRAAQEQDRQRPNTWDDLEP
jgi:predicted DNA-binding transcriptional regulator AlpA